MTLQQHYKGAPRGEKEEPPANTTQGAILEVAPLAPVELSDEAAPNQQFDWETDPQPEPLRSSLPNSYPQKLA